MLRFLFFLVLITCSYKVSAKYEEDFSMSNGRIVGGIDANITNFPYHLSLIFGMNHICSAVIIGGSWALTAAHCVVGMRDSNFRLRAGSSTVNTGGNLHQVVRTISHNSFNSTTLDYDIAVVQIVNGFALGTSGINLIPLATTNTRPGANTIATISGWGATADGGSLNENLRSASVLIMSLANCRTAHGIPNITDRMACAGAAGGGAGPCQGDNGGPLVIINTLVGIASRNTGCGRPNSPAVYTCIGTLREWIRANSGI